MAEHKKKPKKKTKNQFKKGVSGNPFGRPTMSDAEKDLSLKTRHQFKMILNKYMITDEKDLKKLYKSSNLPVLDGMIIKSLLNTFESGDQAQMNWFLNHTLGKEKETKHINFTGVVDTTTMNAKDYTKEELLSMQAIHEAKKLREEEN